MGSFMFKAKTLPLLHKTLLPLTLTSTSTSISLLRMAFSTGPNPYFPSQPEPEDPFFFGFGITDSDEYYAKNNPFQKSGPRTTQKGAVVKIALAKSDDLYMRVDMPGVSKNKMFYFGDPYNFVYFEGSAPKEWEYDRRSGKEVLKFFWSAMLLLSSRPTSSQFDQRCAEDEIVKEEPGVLYTLLHPFQRIQTKGPMNSFGATKVNAGFFVWVDMPGATKETVSVRVKDGSVLFAGEAEMDSNQVESGRTYDGSFGPFDMSKLGDIKAEVNYGVLKMLINYRK